MTKNLQTLQKKYPVAYDFFPRSYVLPEEFRSAVEELEEHPEYWFIAKPSSAAQGKGILFINDPEKIPRSASYTISHYINNPYLINGYKFDLRIYVCI
jgi:tubulin polyglutamylase TTLL5